MKAGQTCIQFGWQALAACLLMTFSAWRGASAGELNVPLSVTENVGLDRANAHVTSGVPFPRGAAHSNTMFRLLDEQQREVPLQSKTTATWRDGSIKWALLDFQLPVKAGQVRQLVLKGTASAEGSVRPESRRALACVGSGLEIHVDTGAMQLVFGRDPGFLKSVWATNAGNGVAVLHDALAPQLLLARGQSLGAVKVQAPEELLVEENGPLRAVVRASGWITHEETNKQTQLIRYNTRVTAFAGSVQFQVQHTITQLSDHKMLLLADHSLELPLCRAAQSYMIGGGRLVHSGTLTANGTARLTQLTSSGYRVESPSGLAESGPRAGGWFRLRGENFSLTSGVKHLWQQFPKAAELTRDGLRFHFFAGGDSKPFDMDQGLGKTHEFFVDCSTPDLLPQLAPEQLAAFECPLFAIAPSEWYCESKVFGDLLPFDFDRFPDYETLTEASADQFIKRMATGLRHWGDVYYGGEYKGTNSYTNLEYDMHHNFLVQFARTGLRKYLDTAITMAGHQADIDTNHKTGWQWKHSPRHTEIQAEFGHTFTRGLLEAYFFTGKKHLLEAATTLGDYFTRQIQNPRELGNERQIGWALISLLPVYEATWEPRYLAAASNTVERLLAGLDANGKFSIRWDNRISFFNGIAATGFLYYYRATGDERVADAAFRVIRRTQGFYPEYAGRTLEAIAWACERTKEPEWFDYLARTWETTMSRQVSWNVMELGAPTIFTVHALPFMTRTGLLPEPTTKLSLTPAQFDTANSMHAHHLPAGDGELYLQPPPAEAVELVIFRKGAWKAAGTATVHDAAGKILARVEYPQESAIWQRQTVQLPKSKNSSSFYHVRFRSPNIANVRGGSYVTWDAVTSKPCPAVFSTPGFCGFQFVTPALFSVPQADAPAIELEIAAEGEGFKRAVIYDPHGRVAGSVDGFIDLGDKARYHYKVRAEIPVEERKGVWSVSLQDVTLEKMNGLVPCFSTSKQSYFLPEQPR